MPVVQNTRLKDGFGQCSSTVLRDTGIGIREKALYAYLCTFADSQSNMLYVSVFRMAADMNISKQTVLRSLKQLETINIITRSDGRGRAKVTTILK